MTPAKRLFDIALAVLLGSALLLPSALIALWLLAEDGRPVLHVSERMRAPDRPFALWKFRTMRQAAADGGVSGGDKTARITRAGRILRRLRLDEIPQLWNILKGDMSFVGPRPPLRRYVEHFPGLYARVLRSRPGLTGMATLHFRRHEERLLARCRTPQETEATYVRRCVARKARLDLIYQRHGSLCLDLALIGETLAQLLRGKPIASPVPRKSAAPVAAMKSVRTVLLGVERGMTRVQKAGVILLADAAIVPVCFFLTALLIRDFWPQMRIERLAVLFPALAVLGAMASLAAGLPRVKLKTYASFAASGLLPYVLLAGAGTLSLTLLPGMEFPVIGMITFSMVLFFAAILVRVAMLRVLLWVLADRPRTRVLIYGAGRTGQQLASALQSHETISVVAFIDDDPALHVRRLMGRRIHPPQQIERLMHRFAISRVLLAMPSLPALRQAQISRRLQALGLGVQALPSFAQLVGIEQLVESLAPVPVGRFLGRSQLDGMLAKGAPGHAGKVVLVTGAGGSVGSELCRQLVAQHPRKLVLYDVSELALYTVERDLHDLMEAAGGNGTEIVPVLGSVTDARLIRMVLAEHGADTVFHAAAYKHVPLVEQNPVAGIANNVFGTRVLADACVRQGVRRFVLVSTDKAVRPSNVMGASKRLAELVVQDRAKRSRATHFSIVRFGNVLGSSGSVIPLFREQIARGGPVTLTHEEVTRYFMTIAEAARLVLLAGSFEDPAFAAAADVFVLDMGKPVRIRQLVEQMIQGAGHTVRDAANPDGDIEIRVIGLRPGEKLHEELLIGRGLLPTPHPKILRAAEESLSEEEMAEALRGLIACMATGNADAIWALSMLLVRPRQAPPLPARVAVAGA